jgi:hypothetical protein
MATRIGKANFRLWSLLMLSTGCSLIWSAPALGQSSGDPGKIRMQEMDRRELQLTNLGRNSQNNDPRHAQAIMDQVSQDFQRILKLHNEMVRAITTNSSLNYEFISDATGEIKKRATRLQSVLQLQKPESAQQNRTLARDLERMETKDKLILLCRQIESFIRNPIIETPGTVDARQLERARGDLQSVIELSSAIKRAVYKQKKI